MMTDNQEPLADLLALTEDATTGTFLTLAWKTAAPDYRVCLVELEDDVSKPFLNYAHTEAASLASGTRIDYDPEWILKDHEYFELALDEFPTTNLFDELSDFQNLDSFAKKNLTKPKLYVVALQGSEESAFFGKQMAYLQVLKQKAGLFAAVWDGSTFNALTDSVATFSQRFDWVVWRDTLYIQDANAFHREFRSLEVLLAAVSGHVEGICTRVSILNAESMIKRCQSSVKMASKLKRISERGLHLSSSIDELKQYAIDYDIGVTWSSDALVFDGSLESQWDILKLLDEDRTEGPLTHRHYESAAKREV
jgi:Domain of unknown function (DUF4868)